MRPSAGSASTASFGPSGGPVRPKLAPAPRLVRGVSGSTPDVWCRRECSERVDGPIIHENLVVQMGTRGMSGGADQAERGPLMDRLTWGDVGPGEMPVQRTNPITMIDNDRLSI